MRHREPALALSTAVAATAAVLAVAAPQATPLRVLLGSPLVLLLPGYGLTRALFPHGALGRLERATTSVALSIALVVFLGLALGPSPQGLGRGSWMVALVGVTLLGNAIAYVRDGTTPGVCRDPVPLPPREYVVLGTVAGAALVATVLVGAHFASRPASGRLLEFWALPASQSRHGEVILGVRNSDSEWTNFHIVVTLADTQMADTWLDVPHGETRFLTVRVPRGATGREPMRALLTAPAARPAERIVMVWPSAEPTSAADWKAR